ncbi:MAG: hypothetical protein Q9207_006343 [Kuettlingeria erythrocarpa]
MSGKLRTACSLLGLSTPIFPKLKTLNLRGFRAPVDDFLSLFAAQPALQHLVLGPVCLAGFVVGEVDEFDDSTDDEDDEDDEDGQGGSAMESDMHDSDPLATHESLQSLIRGLVDMQSLVSWKIEPPVFTNSPIKTEAWEEKGFDLAIEDLSELHKRV